MQWTFPSPSIRLALTLAICIVAVALVAAVQWSDLSSLDRVFIRTIQGDLALAEASARLHEDILQLRRYEKDVLINLGNAGTAADYRARWIDAYASLRRDLLRARAASPRGDEPVLQTFAASVGDYRAGFDRTYELIRSGVITTTQQANDAMNRYKAFVHATESQIVTLQERADRRISRVESVVAPRQWGFGAVQSLTVLAAVAFSAMILRSTLGLAR